MHIGAFDQLSTTVTVTMIATLTGGVCVCLCVCEGGGGEAINRDFIRHFLLTVQGIYLRGLCREKS